MNLLRNVRSLLPKLLTSQPLQKLSVENARVFSVLSNVSEKRHLLSAETSTAMQKCGMKQKGWLRRRCKDCYFVIRDSRLYVMCPTHPRHKQMSMVSKPKNTWILTQATQSIKRAW